MFLTFFLQSYKNNPFFTPSLDIIIVAVVQELEERRQEGSRFKAEVLTAAAGGQAKFFLVGNRKVRHLFTKLMNHATQGRFPPPGYMSA